jgi:hypothetical protein
VSDGLLINLAMVEEGYGVAMADAPDSLLQLLRSAEEEAREGCLGLWSEEALAHAADTHDKEAARLREEFVHQFRREAEKNIEKKARRGRSLAVQRWMLPERVIIQSASTSSRWSDL